jgi:uncharacterized membrane protein YjfL (UPF0719 family)
MEAIFSSVFGLALAVLVAALVAFLGVWLFERLTREVDEWAELRQGNVAMGIVMGAIVLAVGLIVQPAIQGPLVTADLGRSRPFYELLVNAVGLLVALILSVGAIGLAVWLFTRLTVDLEEWSALAADNRAVAILLAGVILTVALLTSTAVERIVVALTQAVF